MVVHDSDIRPGRDPVESEVKLNALIRRLAGRKRTFVLEPDFEGVLGFHSRDHKPERAVRRLADAHLDELPDALVGAARLALQLAQPHRLSYS